MSFPDAFSGRLEGAEPQAASGDERGCPERVRKRDHLPVLADPVRRLRLLEEREVGIDRGDPVPGVVVESRVVTPAARGRSEIPAEDLHGTIVGDDCDRLAVTNVLRARLTS